MHECKYFDKTYLGKHKMSNWTFISEIFAVIIRLRHKKEKLFLEFEELHVMLTIF